MTIIHLKVQHLTLLLQEDDFHVLKDRPCKTVLKEILPPHPLKCLGYHFDLYFLILYIMLKSTVLSLGMST